MYSDDAINMNNEIETEVTPTSSTSDVSAQEQSYETNMVEVEHHIEVSATEDYRVTMDEAFPALDNVDYYNHALLNNRELADAHPISSITGLKNKLDRLSEIKTVYSDERQCADYYEWYDCAFIESGYFVSVVPNTAKIKICNGSNVFGVSVQRAGFIGGQNKTVPRDNNYALVVTSGIVNVRCELDVEVGDYVVSNSYGCAKKTNSGCGYKVLSRLDDNGVEYVSIMLGVQADTTDKLGKDILNLDGRLDAAESNIVSAVNVANQAYNKVNEIGTSNAEMSQKVDVALDVVNRVESGFSDLNNQLAGTSSVATQAKAIAQSAATSAESMRNEAVKKANEALESTSSLRNDFTQELERSNEEINITKDKLEALGTELIPLSTWISEDGTQSGITGFIAQSDENASELALVSNYEYKDANGSVVSKGIAGLMSQVEKNKSEIDLIVSFEADDTEGVAALVEKVSDHDAQLQTLTSWKTEQTETVSTISQKVSANESNIGILSSWKDKETTTVAGIQTSVNKHESDITSLTSWQGDTNTAMARIEQKADANGAYIQSSVSNINKYSVGPNSQAYGFTLEQAENVLEEGMIYVPTEDVTETYAYIDVENNTQTYTRSFLPGYLYKWGKLANSQYGWITVDKNYSPLDEVNISTKSVYFQTYNVPEISENDTYGYWYTNGDELTGTAEGYNAYTLYKWDSYNTTDIDGNNIVRYRWVAVATLAGNASNRAVSQIRQDANSINLEVTNARGGASSLSARIDDAESNIQMMATWQDEFAVGGRNYILNSANLSVSGLGATAGSRKEYQPLNVGQSYMNIADGTDVVISFDLEMTVNTKNPSLQVYNTNNKGPKTIRSTTLNFTASVGKVIKGRYSVKTTVIDRSAEEATAPDNYIEFYSTYGTSNWFKITNVKLELGPVATDWTSAPEDVENSIAGVKATANATSASVVTIAQNIGQNGEVTAATIVAAVNDGKSSINLDADHINFEADNYTIRADKIDFEGSEFSVKITDEINNAVNNIEIGGANLLQGTKTFDLEKWNNAGGFTYTIDKDGFTVANKSVSGATTSGMYSLYSPKISVAYNDQLTLSFWMQVDDLTVWGADDIFCILQMYNSNGVRIGWHDCRVKTHSALHLTMKPAELSTEWTYYTMTFNVGSTPLFQPHVTGGYTTADFVNVDKFDVRFVLAQNGSLSFKKVKLETGNKATDWTLAREEQVSTNNVIAAINLSKEGVQISGDKVDITGNVSFSSAQAKIDKSICETIISYALSSSQTSAPTSGWDTTAPQWENGKYMWQQTVVKYNDGTFSKPVQTCIQGANGNDGVSITGVVTQYHLSNKADKAPAENSSEWTEDFQNDIWPNSSNASYIWRRDVYSYSDGRTPEPSTPVVDKTSTVIAGWCDSNDKTLINGGKIAANSITANQINTKGLHADYIEVLDDNGDVIFKADKAGKDVQMSGANITSALTVNEIGSNLLRYDIDENRALFIDGYIKYNYDMYESSYIGYNIVQNFLSDINSPDASCFIGVEMHPTQYRERVRLLTTLGESRAMLSMSTPTYHIDTQQITGNSEMYLDADVVRIYANKQMEIHVPTTDLNGDVYTMGQLVGNYKIDGYLDVESSVSADSFIVRSGKIHFNCDIGNTLTVGGLTTITGGLVVNTGWARFDSRVTFNDHAILNNTSYAYGTFQVGATDKNANLIVANYDDGNGAHNKFECHARAIFKNTVTMEGSGEVFTSDRNAKNSIQLQPEIYSQVFDKLNPVIFKYNNGTSDRYHHGLIAQDVEDALQEVGMDSKYFAALCYETDEDGNKQNYGIRYTELISMCIYEIQKLKARVAELEAE